MPRYQKHIQAGDVYEIEEYFSPRTIGTKYSRADNLGLSPEEQKLINERNARKKLARLVNQNFRKGDLFVTLTHKERVNYKSGREELTKFLRKVREWREKQGLTELKYIAVTETTNRTHHHVLMSEMDWNQVKKFWTQGRVMLSDLEAGGEYTGIAKYVTKEPREKNKRRWSQSRNLEQPKVKAKKMKSVRPGKRLRAPKGYREVERQEYYCEVTGTIRYLKAIRDGGVDWAEGGREPGEEGDDV